MKYWLRKPGTSDFTGPLSPDEIREQIQSGSVTWDFEALEATGQTYGAIKRSRDWTDTHSESLDIPGSIPYPAPVTAPPASA